MTANRDKGSLVYKTGSLFIAAFCLLACSLLAQVTYPSTAIPSATLDSSLIATAVQQMTTPTQPVYSPTETPPAPMISPAPTLTAALPPVEAGLITHGDRSSARVALTFDACETPGNPAGFDQAIFDILTQTNTPATFFLGGLWMQSHPDETQALAANPSFELGNHSWSHPDFTALSPDEMSAEIDQTADILFRLTGRRPTLFRLPFGTYNDQVLEVIAAHGYRLIQWEVVTGDPDPNLSAEDILRAVRDETQNGSIIIMHANGRGWHTAEALPGIIEHLRDSGYQMVTVSQLLGLIP